MAEVSLELIQTMFQRLQDGLDRVLHNQDDHRRRTQSLETDRLTSLRVSQDAADALMQVRHRMDRIEARIARVERRLDISDD